VTFEANLIVISAFFGFHAGLLVTMVVVENDDTEIVA
jgi:hypothetical protein